MSSDAIPPDALPRIRRFNRAVTAEIGALDASFLGRGRPMGEARMIHAIGRADPAEGREVAEIRDELRLDSGLASRLLRALEAQGLAEVRRHPRDGRRRVARLTRARPRTPPTTASRTAAPAR